MKTLKTILIVTVLVVVAQVVMLIIDVCFLGIDLRSLQPSWRPMLHYTTLMIMGMAIMNIINKIFRK